MSPEVIARAHGLIGWFYNHLARLIYAESVSWRPVNLRELKEYVEPHRKSHYLEGDVGEFIAQNSMLYLRESRLYVDIEGYEDQEPIWSVPTQYQARVLNFKPPAIRLVEAMSSLGLFTERGLKAVSDVWGKVEFQDDNHWGGQQGVGRTTPCKGLQRGADFTQR